ncbi:preprotein translocase subunit SecY [Nevskia sp.]|uniref:preprotein translocase subunit SecY n=1 Tax=Nevskia sp. TaxID=1929292 RepID=UPI003458CD6D
MAKTPGAGGMMPDLSKLGEVRSRLLFLLGALIVYRIGSFIPVPGIDPVKLAQLFDQQKGTILDMFNMFSGGALRRLSIFALGVTPYISASIIVQLMAATTPQLKELKKEGEAGRRKLTKYTRYGTLGLATFQAVGAAYALQSSVALAPGFGFIFTAAVSLVTGTMFMMWLGEQITERGIGNGMSMLIFAGIVSSMPAAVGATAQLISEGSLNPVIAILVLALVGVVTTFVVFVERAQRRIPIHHARRQQGRKLFAAQTQHLPLKLNMAGVIPPIFASSIILFPASMVRFFGGEGNGGFMQSLANALSPGQALYTILYALMMIFFCFFYTALVFDSRETAENLKKSGAFVPGVRPGLQTAKYIDNVLTRLTVAGAIYITAVCLTPEFLVTYFNVPFTFGGTSLLITVVVVMDFMAQLQAHLMSHQYDGLLKKANLKSLSNNAGRPGVVRPS